MDIVGMGWLRMLVVPIAFVPMVAILHFVLTQICFFVAKRARRNLLLREIAQGSVCCRALLGETLLLAPIVVPETTTLLDVLRQTGNFAMKLAKPTTLQK
jgi:hypothetical protein